MITNDDEGGNPATATPVHHTVMKGKDFQV